MVTYDPNHDTIAYLIDMQATVEEKSSDVDCFRRSFYRYSNRVWSALSRKSEMTKITEELKQDDLPKEDGSIYYRFKGVVRFELLFCALERYMVLNPFTDDVIEELLHTIRCIQNEAFRKSPQSAEFSAFNQIYRFVLDDYGVMPTNSKNQDVQFQAEGL